MGTHFLDQQSKLAFCREFSVRTLHNSLHIILMFYWGTQSLYKYPYLY